MEELILLGKTDIRISRLGLGCWQWGDRVMWSYGKTHTERDTREAFDASLAAGFNFFDTAEVYGWGRSERLLGQYLRETPPAATPLVVASKFMPLPWRLRKGSLRSALRATLRRLQLPRVDLYQIHFPFRPVPLEVWADALADALEAGLTRAVGVSNYGPKQMSRAYETLAKRGVLLASNQVEYHLLDRGAERDGLLDLCHKLGVTLIAYSPLDKGMLTGKYTPETPLRGARRFMVSKERLRRIQPLIQLMREIGQAHDDKTPAQVALNWLISKGTVAIPGAKNARQARDNAGALGWRLAESEVSALDAESEKATAK